MAVLANTFLGTSLVAPANVHSMPLTSVHKSRHPFILAASLQNTEDQQHVHRKKSPSPSSWIFFFLSGSSRKPLEKLLIEDMETGGTTAFHASTVVQEPAKIVKKKGPRSVKRVTFTAQKARELREKLKETEYYHDFMYHSAIASRLASNDS